MQDVISIILTDPGARSSAEVENLLVEYANIAAPWADELPEQG